MTGAILLALLITMTFSAITMQIQTAKAAPIIMTGINYMSAGNAYADSDQQLQTDFQRFSNDGIKHISIRMMWSVMMPTSTAISTTALNNIKRVLNAAQNNNIKVNLDFWTQFGYTLGFPTSWAGTDYYSLLTQPTQNYWLSYVHNIVTQLKDYPALESWAILNEPYYDPNTHADQKIPFQNLMANIVQTIKAVDPTRQVICRFALSYTPGSGKYDASIYNLFDAFAVTIYIDPTIPNDTTGNGRWSYWQNTVADCKARNIPLWAIEFGNRNTDPEYVRQYYENSLLKFQSDGVVKAYAWAWQTRSAASEPYNIYDGTNPKPAYYELTNYPQQSTPTPTQTPVPTPTPPQPTPTQTAATQIINDGFESGTFNTWTSTGITSGEVANIVNNPVYTGTHSAQFKSNGQGGYERAAAYESISPSINKIHTQAYLKIAQNGMTESSDRLKLVELRAGSAIVASAGLWQRGSELYWWMEARDGANYLENFNVPVTIDINVWFKLELAWQSSATIGGAALLINGIPIYETYNLDADNYGNCSQVGIGLTEAYNCLSTTLYADNITIDYLLTSSTNSTPTQTATSIDTNDSSQYSYHQWYRSTSYWRRR